MANIFHTYFTRVGQSLAEQITKDKNYTQPKVEEPEKCLTLPKVTPALIRKHISMLPNNKSSGIKALPTKAIKAGKDYVSRGLSHIINKGKIPKKWKSAIIIPCLKGGQKETISNYRPISVLPFTDKILE